jgi:hypothetical protein
MKKIIPLILLTFIIVAKVKGQNAYYDALFLKKYISVNNLSPANAVTPEEKKIKNQLALSTTTDDQKKTITKTLTAIKILKRDSIFSILIKYKIISYLDTANATLLKKAIQSNPFFASVDVGGLTRSNEGVLNFDKNIGNIASSIGGLDVTDIADRIAKFLIKRGKQELGIAFFNKFKEIIDKDKDLKTLFPNTVELLDAIDVDIYDYSAYLQNLREAFKKDIAALPKDLPGIVDNHTGYFNVHTNLKAELLSACYLANELENKSHPGDILANFPDSLLQFTTGPNQYYLKGAIQTLQLISNSLKDTATSEDAAYWVSSEKIGKLINDNIAFRIYLGLLYQQTINDYAKIPFDDTNNLAAFLTKAATIDKNIEAYKKYIKGFDNKLDGLNKMIKEYKTITTDSIAIEKYANYFKAVVGLMEYCTTVGDLPLDNSTIAKTLKRDFHKEFKPYFDVSYDVADIVIDVTQKNYSGAINGVVFIYNEVRVKPMLYAASVAKASTALKNDADTTKKSLTSVIKYGGFMATFATAKNSDEVENAIEAAALPVGSYSIKQKSANNISLNGYIGYGLDFRSGLYAHGIYAPIGFSGSLGLWKKSGGALTLFVSVIDVGGLVSYRLVNGPTDSLKQQVRLESIISPSAQLLFEIPGTPVAVGAGWRMTPKLFYSKESDFMAVPSKSVFNVSLLIDIPLFTLHNTPFK